MNKEYLEKLNLKCTFCKDNTYIKDSNFSFFLECFNKDCKHNKNDTLFLRIGTNDNNIDFYINSVDEDPFGFNTEYDYDEMIPLSKEKMISLLEEYSRTSDIEPIRQKYFTLMLFK